jgi:hypothetical protein
LLFITVIVLAGISYGFAAPSVVADYPISAQSLITAGSNDIGIEGSSPSGLFFLCEDDASTDKAPADKEKSDEEAPGLDRTWDVVMYG